jgi:hypothetical protein
MLRTLLANQAPPVPPPLVVGPNDRRQHELERPEARDTRRFPHNKDDLEFPRDDRRIQTRTLRLDFPRFDGDNPSGWSYKVNQFFDYYQTPHH